MGNRAVVKPYNNHIGVYLHWNGGPESIDAFLTYCKLKKFREFEDAYGLARFCQVVGNFFGGELSLGIEEAFEKKDYIGSLDNGIYEVRGWDVVDHITEENIEKTDLCPLDTYSYDNLDLVKAINASQPEKEQLDEDYLESEYKKLKNAA